MGMTPKKAVLEVLWDHGWSVREGVAAIEFDNDCIWVYGDEGTLVPLAAGRGRAPRTVGALIYDEMVAEEQAPPAWIEEPMWVADDELLYRAGDVRAVQQALMEGDLR